MVNTFVIDSKTEVTARALDDRRLGKQRSEAVIIINVLSGKSHGWKNHPAVKSWIGHVEALKDYCNIIISEWVRRGKKNNMELYKIDENPIYPNWYTNSKIHYSHMARLKQKDPKYYSSLCPPLIYNSYGYIWPCKWTEKELTDLSVERLAEPFTSIKICNAIKKDKKECNNKASFGDKCGVHKKKEKEKIKKVEIKTNKSIDDSLDDLQVVFSDDEIMFED